MCLGDSITIGSRSYLGYPEYAARFLSVKTQKDWNLYNCARAGFTTIDLVRHIDSKWGDLKLVKPDLITIMVGTNDLKRSTTADDFAIAYRQLIVKSRLLLGNANLLLLKIPLLQTGVMLPYHSEMNTLVKVYNEIIQEIADELGLLCHEMICQPEEFFDGVHLTDAGSRSWGQQLTDFILNLRNL